jgi:RNA recognition motif-containing protein
MKIFVAKLSYDTMENELRTVFERYGQVDSVKVIIDKEKGRSKGFGFVEMPNEDEAKAALAGLNETELDGRTIVVKEAEDRPRSSSPRGGGYGSGGGRTSGGFNKGGDDRNRAGGYDRNRGGYDRNKNEGAGDYRSNE